MLTLGLAWAQGPAIEKATPPRIEPNQHRCIPVGSIGCGSSTRKSRTRQSGADHASADSALPAPKSAAAAPATAARHPQSWALWLTAASEATLADMAISQHCLRTVPGCTEANPLLRGSAVRAWTIDLSLTAAMALWSRRLERHHHRWWLLPLVALTAGHVIGAILATHLLKKQGSLLHP